MKAAFYTLGCKVNQYETSVMAGLFAAGGFDVVEPNESADVYILNSCTVTGESDRKSRQALRRFRRQNPAAVICLVGCFPQAFPEEARRLPEADIIMGTSKRTALLPAVKNYLDSTERINNIIPYKKGDTFEPMRAVKMPERTRAFLKIQDGCEHGCAYCIIPKARGPVRSKALPDITEEVCGLSNGGYKEIVLTGINLSCYGWDLGLRLVNAIEAVCAVHGVERVRLGSLEPELLTVGDIYKMAALEKLCPQFHLSLQSGCDITLARMRRRYHTGDYRRVVCSLRDSFPDCAITTDIMAGFPGETDEDHKSSLEFALEIQFAKVHVFTYSPRPGTPAAEMPNQVPNAVKSVRSKEMLQAMEESRLSFLSRQTGTHTNVLLETGDGLIWHGYTPNYTPVRVKCEDGSSGEIREVLITGLDGDGCIGELY